MFLNNQMRNNLLNFETPKLNCAATIDIQAMQAKIF